MASRIDGRGCGVIASRICHVLAVVVLLQSSAIAQPSDAIDPGSPPPSAQLQQGPPTATGAYVPITFRERITWIVDGTVGPRSLGVGVIAAAWQTGINSPSEWRRTWTGAGKRYAEREADVAISNAMEAGLGALWGEDPRYIRSGRHGIRSRAGYAIKTVLWAPRRDGRLAPAWGRYAGNVLNNILEDVWLPPSATTWHETTLRSANGMLGRLVGNLWEEFWPDARKHVKLFMK